MASEGKEVTLDTVRETIKANGIHFDENTVPEFMKLYEPLQAKQNAKYEGTITTDSAKYGPHDRHRLKIYRSTKDQGSGPLPVVVFIHGGGFVSHDIDVTPNLYANVGNFFASHGCVAVSITYRLAFQGAHFPDGAEDVASALYWIADNIARYGGDPARVVPMGHSAGGSHLAHALFMGLLDGKDGGAPPLRAAVTLSAAFGNDVDGAFYPIIREYYNTGDKSELATQTGANALFRQHFFGRWDKPGRRSLPCELLVTVTEFEAHELWDETLDLIQAYRRCFRRLPHLEVLKGHDHNSPVFGLGLEGEEWVRSGNRLVEYVKTVTK